MERPKTIFLDIDGTLVKHKSVCENTLPDSKLEILDGTLEKLTEWDLKGYRIILTTGRKESMRKSTEEQLRNLGIFYDMLIMGIGGGDRILINDKKSDGRITAFAICPDRNKGIKDVNV
jgi:hydroxymethylpyrimidine pyrophosphatase-like HAD family hydrolase